MGTWGLPANEKELNKAIDAYIKFRKAKDKLDRYIGDDYVEDTFIDLCDRIEHLLGIPPEINYPEGDTERIKMRDEIMNFMKGKT